MSNLGMRTRLAPEGFESKTEYVKLTKAQRAGIYSGNPLIAQHKFRTIEDLEKKEENIAKQNIFQKTTTFIKQIFNKGE